MIATLVLVTIISMLGGVISTLMAIRQRDKARGHVKLLTDTVLELEEANDRAVDGIDRRDDVIKELKREILELEDAMDASDGPGVRARLGRLYAAGEAGDDAKRPVPDGSSTR